MGFGIGVQDRDPETVVRCPAAGSSETSRPNRPRSAGCDSRRPPWSAKRPIASTMRRQRLVQREPARPSRRHRRRARGRPAWPPAPTARASCASACRRAERQVEPRRIGAVDDVDVVIARQHEHPRGEVRMTRQASKNSAHSAERPASVMSPVMRTMVERLGRVHRPRDEPGPASSRPLPRGPPVRSRCESRIARRRRGCRTDARRARLRPSGRRGIERFEVERLVHARVGEAPDQRRRRQIGRHDDDSVGERRHRSRRCGTDQIVPADPIQRVAGQAAGATSAAMRDKQDAGAGAAYCAHARKLALRRRRLERHPFRRCRIASRHERVSGLHAERVERPEIHSRRCETAAASRSSPARRSRARRGRGADPGQFGKTFAKTSTTQADAINGARPRARAGNTIRHGPGEQQLRQADFDEQASGDRQQRLLLRDWRHRPRHRHGADRSAYALPC